MRVGRSLSGETSGLVHGLARTGRAVPACDDTCAEPPCTDADRLPEGWRRIVPRSF
jgi:hypothetical protein